MSEEAQATAEVVATPATAETTPVQNTAPVQAAAPVTEAAAPEVPAWHEKFPTKYRNNGEPDVDKLIEGYDHLQKKLSSKGYAPPADIAEYGDAAPKSYDIDPEAFTAFKSQAQELGINKDAFAKIIEAHDAEVARLLPPVEVTEAQMKQHWGREYEANLATANRAFKEFIDPSIDASHPVFQNPEVMKFLANVGAQLGEDSNPLPASTSKSGMTQSDIEKMMSDKGYYNDLNAQATVARWFEKNSR